MKPPHVMSEEDRKKPVSLADMFIDVGATSPEEVEALGITIGTPITIDREFVPLAGTCVTGKAFDNRAGCVMLIGALREMQTKHTVYAVFTVQEEVGLKGADNRAGCVMLIGALREMQTKHTVYAVFTVQEEVGLKGAKTSSFALNPDVAIATDVTIPGDSPGIERRKAPVFMGKGPVVVAVSASGRGHIADPRAGGDRRRRKYGCVGD